MKTVAMIAPNSLPVPPVRGGGIQTAISETTKLFRSWKPYVFSICEPGVDRLPLHEVDGNTEHFRIRLTYWEELKINLLHLSTKSYFPYVHEISKKLAEIKPDIIHVHSRPWFVPILRKYLGKEVKIILQNHNNYFSGMKRPDVERYLGLIDGFASVSRNGLDEEVLKRFPDRSRRCFVVYNGVDLKKFRPKWERSGDGLAIRKKFGLKTDDIIVLFVGRICREKGIHTVIEAMKDIIKEHPETKLLVVGSRFYGTDDKSSDFMKGVFKASDGMPDNVIFTGFIPPSEVADFYVASDILAVPSHEEAFGLIYAEAGASGLPVVASKRGAIPEIVEDGSTGLLADDPESVPEVAEKILYFIERPDARRDFGERARQRIESKFTWQATAEALERMYDEVV